VDYLRGAAESTDGTWRVGLDGPPAMIMPGHPKVGDVYRTENIPGVAFEQVTVKRVGLRVDGPTGPVTGAMVGQELHQDERALEAKVFAPGYGEYFSGGGHDFEANALSVPADAQPGPVPAELRSIVRHAHAVTRLARANRWKAVSAELKDVTASWRSYRALGVPHRLSTRMRRALTGLTAAVEGRHRRATAEKALDIVDASLDFELRYRPPAVINRDRLVLWTRQLALDAHARRPGAIHGDVTTLSWIRDRLDLNPAAGRGIDDEIRYLRSAAEAREFRAAATHAVRLRHAVQIADLAG
jgi:hypothetical protein